MIKPEEMWVCLCLASVAVVGCGEKPAGPSTGIVTQLVKSPDADAQAWYFNNPLPVMIGLAALDVNHRPVSGVVVNWASASGGATVSPAVDTTDVNGIATATFTLGPSAATQSITATSSVAGVPSVTFTATASSPPSSANVRVQDDLYNKQGVVVQVGGTVTWQWVGTDFHSVTFATTNAGSPIQSVGSFQRTFNSVGTFNYFCQVHAGNMTGMVTVVN